jgi:chromate transporter
VSRGASERGSALEVLAVHRRLGLSCFGGPIAHIGYFRDEFVVRRRWLDEQQAHAAVGRGRRERARRHGTRATLSA